MAANDNVVVVVVVVGKSEIDQCIREVNPELGERGQLSQFQPPPPLHGPTSLPTNITLVIKSERIRRNK